MAQIHHGGSHRSSSPASINVLRGRASQRGRGEEGHQCVGPSAVVNLTQPRAHPPPRSANGALTARTASWVGRNVAGRCASGRGEWGRGGEWEWGVWGVGERGTRSTLHLFPGSGTNEPERITDTFLKTGISRQFWRCRGSREPSYTRAPPPGGCSPPPPVSPGCGGGSADPALRWKMSA